MMTHTTFLWLKLDVKQLNKTIKLYYFHTLKALWDGQGKIKMYYGMFIVKKQLSEKRFITLKVLFHIWKILGSIYIARHQGKYC